MDYYGDQFRPQVVALDYFKVLGRSKLNINKHIDCAGDYAGNVRLFEATGMGACLITDWKINLPEMFEPDTEIVTYRTSEECEEKVRYLLDHESERQAIAASGQRRTLRDHTYAKRTEQLDEIIRTMLRGPGEQTAYSIGTLAVEGKV
jgi:spore maturation protein CgeB